MKETGCTAVN
jgi:panB: 3-methyl-2-oxobutanoate hydroxymethyltransferase